MRKLSTLLAVLVLAAPLAFYGCLEGDTGPAGAPGANGTDGTDGTDLTATARPESCSVCHVGAGTSHQSSYEKLYQDCVVLVSNLAYVVGGDNSVTVTFKMKKAGVDLDCTKVTNLNIYFTEYDNVLNRFQFASGQERVSLRLKGLSTLVYGGAGLCTATAAAGDNAALLANPGALVVYGYDEIGGANPIPGSRVKQVKYPYAALKYTPAYEALPAPYASAANVKGCERCHTVPYLKHGNIYGRVAKNAASDMITCKACHLDNGEGGHFIWQLLVDDTPLAAAVWAGQKADGPDAGDDADYMPPASVAKYAYETRLMNDVHMSHAMEFEYPQSMANCVACHEGKLDKILTDANFTAETCKSCHPVTGSAKATKPQPALVDIWADAGVPWHNIGTTCNAAGCHTTGSGFPTFKEIHTGYDKKIFTATGVRYSSAIAVTIDNASFAGNVLTFGFSAAGSAGGLAAADIMPTVLVGLYGWDSKDYIVGPHESEGSPSKRLLEFSTFPWVTNNSTRITVTNPAAGKWVVTADLSTWAGKIAVGTVKRVEVAVMPRLEDPALPKTYDTSSSGVVTPSGDNVVALNAPSRTFSLVTGKFIDFYPPIVRVADGCNNCHEALAVNFHTPDRGGNIVVCRLCHITKSGGSHLEMQSRSMDSYAHAIHSFQPFDIDDYDFSDPVSSMFYDLAAEAHYPTFDITNCESCHVAGTFNVPNQAKSLPGVFSKSVDAKNLNRALDNTVPSYVAGPGSRACGSCHRVEWIKEDDAVELASFNEHTNTNGYLLKGANIEAVMHTIMRYFDAAVVLPTL